MAKTKEDVVETKTATNKVASTAKATKVIESTQANEAVDTITLKAVEASVSNDSPPDTVTAPEAKEEPTSDAKSAEAYNELLSIVQMLAKEVQELKSAQAAQATQVTQLPPVYTSTFGDNDKASEIINLLANRRSDKEVIIVHNCELIGGLTTHLDLTGLTIDFRALGEQRVLSWQQFEECVSKYRSFFEKQIILLGDEYAELGVRYSLPCVKRGDNHVMTHDEILKLPTLEPKELERYVKSLTKEDKEFLFSYWLGKCYERTEGFYDRYKVELLNTLSGTHVFENMLILMNGDSRLAEE